MNAKKIPKKKRENAAKKSKTIISESENTDGELIDYTNGLVMDLDNNSLLSISSEGGNIHLK